MRDGIAGAKTFLDYGREVWKLLELRPFGLSTRLLHERLKFGLKLSAYGRVVNEVESCSSENVGRCDRPGADDDLSFVLEMIYLLLLRPHLRI